MSHSHHYLDVTFLHNNSLDSESPVTIVKGDTEIKINTGALLDFVAELVRNKRIARLEQAGAWEILGAK